MHEVCIHQALACWLVISPDQFLLDSQPTGSLRDLCPLHLDSPTVHGPCIWRHHCGREEEATKKRCLKERVSSRVSRRKKVNSEIK
jgi:hypothetical protein